MEAFWNVGNNVLAWDKFVTPCLLPRIREFIHNWHRNITLGLRPRVILLCCVWINQTMLTNNITSFIISLISHHLSHHITSHHITSHHITSHHISSYHITSYHITDIRYITYILSYPTLSYPILYHIISCHK